VPDTGDKPVFHRMRVRWRLSAHGRRLLTLALTGLVVAIITRRPEFIALAAPALLLLASRQPDRPAQLAVRSALADIQIVEDSETAAIVEFAGQGTFTAEVALTPAESISAGPPLVVPPVATPAPAGPADDSTSSRTRVPRIRLPFSAQRWGDRPVGLVTITLLDDYQVTEGVVHVSLPWLDCRPSPAQLQSTIRLSKLPSRLGERPARAIGEGVEFAGVREFVPGDRQRRVNWPATTRRGTLHLSTFSAERTQHIVVVADATSDIGPAGSSSLDYVLRGASGAIVRYLGKRDRVGLIVFGSRLNWIGPGQGRRHLHRLLQLLVSTPSGWERTAGITRLPRAALPPGALVLVFSPLLDPRIIESVRDMRERGFSVVVIDVLNASPEHDGSRISALTARLWRLEQDAIRFSMSELGVPVVHWDGSSSLDEPLMPLSRHTLVVPR